MSNLNSQIVDIINNFLQEYGLVDARTCKGEFLGMHSSLTVGGANEVVKEIEKIIAQQVKEARIEMYNFYGEPRCSQLHHSKKDQHALLEDCPVVCRIKGLKGDNK